MVFIDLPLMASAVTPESKPFVRMRPHEHVTPSPDNAPTLSFTAMAHATCDNAAR